MDIQIDEETLKAVELVRTIGREFLRPLGLEADRTNRPIPPDHPFYELVAKSGYMLQGLGSEGRGSSGSERAPAGGASGGGSRRRGGSRGSALRNVLVAEEGSYWDRGAMVSLPGPGLGGPPVLRMGTEAQRERLLAPFRQRERPVWAAFAMTEPGAGSDVARITTRAVRDADGWVLTGQKMYSSNSPRAEWVVVFATLDPALGRDGHRAFVVERDTPGFEILRVEHKMGLRAYETATFALDGCRLPEESLLGGQEYYEASSQRGFEGAMSSFNATRPIIAAMGVGIARAAYDIAAGTLKEDFAPHAFHRRRRALETLVEVRRRIEVARLMCMRAAWLLDCGMPNALEASMAKLYAPPAALAAVQAAAQVLGEAGVLRDSLVEKLARDVKAMDIVEGTQQIQRRVVSKHVVGVLGPSA